MNWYVLYAMTNRVSKLLTNLNKNNNIEAFVPKYEYFHRSSNGYAIKPMFNGYIFVKTKISQAEFNLFIQNVRTENNSFIKQLVNPEVSALRKEEIKMFEQLLDHRYVLKMSQAFIQDGKAIVVEGPLINFQENIVKVDKHDQVAYLDLSFMDRRIKAGLKLNR